MPAFYKQICTLPSWPFFYVNVNTDRFHSLTRLSHLRLLIVSSRGSGVRGIATPSATCRALMFLYSGPSFTASTILMRFLRRRSGSASEACEDTDGDRGANLFSPRRTSVPSSSHLSADVRSSSLAFRVPLLAATFASSDGNGFNSSIRGMPAVGVPSDADTLNPDGK